jgi:hypothetical protein
MASSNPVSHKRTRSFAENTTDAPETKRRSEKVLEQDMVQKVYIVLVHDMPAYGPDQFTIHGVYADMNDANNALKGLTSDEYRGEEGENKYSLSADGRIFYECYDTGEGNQANISVEEYDVKPPGCEPEIEFEIQESTSEEGDEDEEDEEGDDE